MFKDFILQLKACFVHNFRWVYRRLSNYLGYYLYKQMGWVFGTMICCDDNFRS